MTPHRIRAVVVDHDGGELTIRCLQHVLASDQPPGTLDVVLVENGSRRPVTDRVRRELPAVRVVESATNLGFAGGVNLGVGTLDDVDAVALVNNDAVVSPGWLKPLLETLEREPGVGAASPKILLAARFRELTLTNAPAAPVPGERRALGVRVTGVRVDGRNAWTDVHFPGGTWGPEIDADGAPFRWTTGHGRVLVPGGPVATRYELRLDAPDARSVTIAVGDARTEAVVGPEPQWFDITADGETFDVVNNVGSQLVADGYGADRGFLERDAGQYERIEDVFAWCGAAVLLRADYLRDVGLLDERLFLYSEDFELSWRALQRGWRHRYVPESVVRHDHSATSARTGRAETLKERNRLLVLLRHARPRVAIRALLRFVLVTGSYARRDVVAPLRRGDRPRPVQVRSRLAALAGCVRLAPSMLASRRADRTRPGRPADPQAMGQ